MSSSITPAKATNWARRFLSRHRQRLLLLPRRGQAPLSRLHRLRQHAESRASARAANGDGLHALLGRTKCMSTGSASIWRSAWRASGIISRPGPLFRLHPAGSGPGQGEADRRTVGSGSGRLPAGRISVRLERMERQISRHHAPFLARRRRTCWAISPGGCPDRAMCSRLPAAGPRASMNFVTAHDGFTLGRPGKLRGQAQ